MEHECVSVFYFTFSCDLKVRICKVVLFEIISIPQEELFVDLCALQLLFDGSFVYVFDRCLQVQHGLSTRYELRTV